jgi:hypothetical protein
VADFRPRGPLPAATSFWSPGEAIAWVAALVFMLSSFMGWYSGSGDGITFSVIGWHTDLIGKLVFFVGLITLVFLAVRAAGAHLPIPAGAIVALLGAAGTILVLVRVISIPEELQPAGRGIGIWISLGAGVLLILAGLLKAADEM